MESRDMVCIVCPVGCHMQIIEDKESETGYLVTGAGCKRGPIYGVKELSNPTRLLTSTVKINGGILPRIPVRTDIEIQKDKIFEVMEVINSIELTAPVKMGQILAENILGLGVNIISSKSVSA
jgi:CxxC motif-containing protein